MVALEIPVNRGTEPSRPIPGKPAGLDVKPEIDQPSALERRPTPGDPPGLRRPTPGDPPGLRRPTPQN